MEDRTIVVVSRKWDNPSISITVTNEGLGISMSLDDFVNALASESGNPTLLVTRTQLLTRLKTSALTVVSVMKQATVQVM